MSSVIPLLSNVKVAAPCSASWQSMEAVDGDRVHFCGECKKNVYNLSAMTQTQAEGLLREHEGHLCVRYYQRTDGTILTQNCPVGQAALRMQMIARSKRAALATAAVLSIAALGNLKDALYGHTMGDPMPSKAPIEQTAPVVVDPRATMGSPSFDPEPQVERAPLMGKVPAVVAPPKVESIGKMQNTPQQIAKWREFTRSQSSK